MKILECSSKGDKRFSAFYAKIEVYNKLDSIENHYQLCKRFGDKIPKNWCETKGKTPTHICINNKKLDVKFLTQYYYLLWCKYLDNNPGLVKIAKEYDNFNDMFRGKSVNCQADVIKKYIKDGRGEIIKECKELINILKKT